MTFTFLIIQNGGAEENTIVSLKIKELDGTAKQDYPVTVSQVFKKGDFFSGEISVTVNGIEIPSRQMF